MTALAALFQWLVLGLHARVPWEAAREPAESAAPLRRLWALAAAPLLLAAGVVALWSIDARLDAALAWGFSWPPRNLPLLFILFLGAALGLADILLLAGYRQLEPLGWRIVAGLGWALLASASVAGELLRIGRGPGGGLLAIALASLVRLVLALATAEAIRGSVGRITASAGLLLPLSVAAFPAELRGALRVDFATLGAAALLLLAANALPQRFRRPAAFAGLLLAALFLARSGELSASLERPSTIPDLLLPEP